MPASRARADDILLLSGSSQALDLVNGALLTRGDTVICEKDNYQSTLTRFARLGVESRSAFRSTATGCAWTRSPPRSPTARRAACSRR